MLAPRETFPCLPRASPCLQRTAGREHPPRRQHWLPGGGEVPEDPAGGGPGAWPGVQTFPPQHHLPVHGAGVSHHRRGTRGGASPLC